MIGRIWLYLGLAVAASPAFAAQQAAQPAADSDKDWAAIARQDVGAAYELYAANHPGMHDPANPGFRSQLERARGAGLEAAKVAATPEGYAQALGAFSAIIQDGHALAVMKSPAGVVLPIEWPGFTVAWRGDKAFVRHAGSSAVPPPGTELIGCDGLGIADFVKLRMRARPFRPAEAGQWWFWSPRAFTSTPAFQEGRPRNCIFRDTAGMARNLPLSWSPAPKHFDQWLGEATDGDRLPIGLSEPRPGLFLIGMQDFQPDEAGVKAYEKLFEELKRRRGEIKQARAVVIDMRYNNGGSSGWSRQGARDLWGDEPVDRRMNDYFKAVQIWWRASEGNVAYMDELVAKVRKNGQYATADSMEKVRKGMLVALKAGEPFHVEADGDSATASTGDEPPVSDFTTPVYVITRGACGSACLDAVDTFTRFSNVKLIGAPTAADSTYMEVRVTDLPSGEGRIVVPNKLWAGRPRASGQVYQPHILVDDLSWSTATFLDRVEADLNAAH